MYLNWPDNVPEMAIYVNAPDIEGGAINLGDLSDLYLHYDVFINALFYIVHYLFLIIL